VRPLLFGISLRRRRGRYARTIRAWVYLVEVDREGQGAGYEFTDRIGGRTGDSNLIEETRGHHQDLGKVITKFRIRPPILLIGRVENRHFPKPVAIDGKIALLVADDSLEGTMASLVIADGTGRICTDHDEAALDATLEDVFGSVTG
jgi:hypothetical protein